jgi:hypothetical protein
METGKAITIKRTQYPVTIFEIISEGCETISHKTLWKRNWNPSNYSYTIKYIKFIFEIFRIINPLTR